MDLVKNKDAQKVLTWITDRYRITTTQHTFLESLLENTDTHVEYPYVPEMLEAMTLYGLHYLLRKKNILFVFPTFSEATTAFNSTLKRIDEKYRYDYFNLQFMFKLNVFRFQMYSYEQLTGVRYDLAVVFNCEKMTLPTYVFADYSVVFK